ncbi:hypothetical protein KHQ06_12970 [Nocardia tengchongensis]|uniref:LuxR family transcriptional regulator n=1 Tax=Nocardia tengchongensis TaxID=2055889 RepID=A0ABX8CYV5_9NOCA|nr:hypothetical protein [Nocardia tengchongensis]QVI23670.1 hypothetical protein KHQ06_12970 [Nocardia tengchongensis]
MLAERYGPLGALRLSRILTLAAGNPLALLELPGVVGDLAGTAPEPMTLGPGVRAAFQERVTALPAAVRVLLTVAATETRGVLSIVTTAAAALGVDSEAWEYATAAGLLAVSDGRVERTHALLCAAVHEAATVAECRAAQLAVAAALTESGDADLGAWHRALAAARPDEPLAAALTARAADTRQGPMAAAAMLRQAAAISPDPERAGERLAAAGRFAWAGGDIASAHGLLDRATARLGPERAAVAARGLAGLLEFVAGEPERASRLLLRDAELVDPATAANLRIDAERARWVAGHAVLDLDPAEMTGREGISRFHTMIRPLPPAPWCCCGGWPRSPWSPTPRPPPRCAAAPPRPRCRCCRSWRSCSSPTAASRPRNGPWRRPSNWPRPGAWTTCSPSAGRCARKSRRCTVIRTRC